MKASSSGAQDTGDSRTRADEYVHHTYFLSWSTRLQLTQHRQLERVQK